ncbi:MAG: PEGA domain-containing protein [Myxococcales bacterium]|nr:PEGA domain-containing protein [Myxococcales bacterium]
MRRPGLFSRALIAALVAALSAGPAVARPLLLPAEVAAASSGPRLAIVVVPLDAPSRLSQGVLELVADDAARVSGRFEVISPRELFEPQAAAERTTKVEAARARMTAGQTALDELDTAKGVEAFADAVKQLKETDTSRTFDDLLKAWVMKAASHAMGGEVPPAKQEIERIIAVQPRAEFNSQFFPPELIKFVEQQRKLANGAKGELNVRTEPPGANIWVNGQHRGQSPVTVNGLLGSRHEIVAGLGGYVLSVTELPPGDATLELKPAELRPALVKAVDTISKAPKGPTRDQALMALGKTLKVDQVLAFLVKKSTVGEQSEVTALRLEVRDGHNAAYATTTQPLGTASDALKTFIDGLVAADAPRQGKSPVSHFEGDGGGGSGKTVVGIALLGVAAGLVAAGIGTGVIGQERYTQFRATPQVQTGVSSGLANEARAYGGVSLGSFIGAGIAAGVGTFLLASGGGGAAADEPEPTKKKPALKKKDEPAKKEALKKDEPPKKKDEPKKEEPPKKEAPPTKEEPKKDEPPKKEEPVKVDPKEEKRRKDEEARKEKEEAARLKKEEQAQAEAKKKAEADEKKAKADEAKRAEDERKKQEADAKAGKKTDDAKKKADEEAAAKAAAEVEKKKKEEEERKKKEDEERKKKEEEEKKKKEQDHDDLRNY